MQKLAKKLETMVCVLAVAAVLTLCSAAQVKAAEPYIEGGRSTVLQCENHFWNSRVHIEGVDFEDIRILSVKSDNKACVSVIKSKTAKNEFDWQGLKKGKATITVKYKYKGKTYTLTKKVRVLSDQPFQYIKYGSTNVYKGNEYKSNFRYVKKSLPLTFKLKKGYKLEKAIFFMTGDTEDSELENGMKIPLKKGKQTWCSFTIKNKKGQTMEYRVIFEKK